ncbi:MAG: stalk domain-containing protein [Caldisericia bacterium]|nr:stalk domain-containing protein [Caldisericia bacterium]
MRKIVSATLALFLCFSVMASFSFASAASKTVLHLKTDAEVIFIGTEFTIQYTIEEAEDVWAIGFDALYEKDKFELVQVKEGNFLEQDKVTTLPVYNDRKDEGVIIFGITRTGDTKGVNGNGTIIQFVFKALEMGTFKFNVKNVYVKDPAGADIKVDITPLEIEIIEEDTEPPFLELTEIGSVSEETVLIEGKTEPEALVTIDDEEVTVKEDGSFSHEVTLEVGENEFVVIAKDLAGNETKKTLTVIYIERVILKLQIGNKTVYVNGKAVEIEAAPFVDKNSGRTLVPIRIVAESVGAQIGWEGTERKITLVQGDTIVELWIGKPIAEVNDVPTPIDVNAPNLSPMVVNGRTVLPLRFVAENLGCGIGWDGATQTITLTYPDPENK